MLEICQHHDTQLSFKNKNKSEWNCNDFERRRKKKRRRKKNGNRRENSLQFKRNMKIVLMFCTLDSITLCTDAIITKRLFSELLMKVEWMQNDEVQN